jgi:hypothetical protein
MNREVQPVRRSPIAKSLSQLQREAREQQAAEAEADPWACRSCGCRDWRVADSRLRGTGPRRRERICRHCGEPLPTQELPVPDGFKLVVVPEEAA